MATVISARRAVFGDLSCSLTGAATRALLFDGGLRSSGRLGDRLVNLGMDFTTTHPEAVADQHAHRGAVLCAGDDLGVAPGAALLGAAYPVVFPRGYLSFVREAVSQHGPIDVTAHAYSAVPSRELVLEGSAMMSRLSDPSAAWRSTVLAAAGHTGAHGVRFPALCPSVLAIGVCDAAGSPASYCSVSPELRKPELLVPEGQYSTLDEDGVPSSIGGTSAAVNIAAGVALLWCERLRALGIEPLPTTVKAVLLATSRASARTEHRILSGEPLCGDAAMVVRHSRDAASASEVLLLRAPAAGKLVVCVVADQVDENARFQDARPEVRITLGSTEAQGTNWARAEIDVTVGAIVECRVEVSGRPDSVGLVACNAVQREARAPAVVRRDRIVVGIGASHDAAGCVIRNGKLERAVQLERLTRVKHDGKPMLSTRESVDYCLRSLGIRADDVDLFCFNLQSVLPGYAGLSQPVASAEFDLFDPFGERALFVSHHLAHAYGAFFCSPFEGAAVFVADGSGGSTVGAPDLLLPGPLFREYLATGTHTRPALHVQSGYLFDRHSCRMVVREEAPSFNVRCGSSSLGETYASVSQYVFGDWQASGKLMGLAPYGVPEEHGPSALVRDASSRLQFGTAWKLGLNAPARGDDPMRFRHLAARIQADFETALLERVRAFLKETSARNLAYAGGLALNSVANEKIAALVGAPNFYVMPASSDAGIAIGAAAAGEHRLTGATVRAPVGHDFHGHPYGERDCQLAIAQYAPAVVTAPAEIDDVADALAAGNVVGWFEGSSEFGPRALGHRSLLADPRKKEMWLHINRQIKFREDFRPFAPMVPRELANEYFELEGESPYMLRVVRVRERYRAMLGAITHVDGSARVQTVDERFVPRIHALLHAFGRRSGVAVLLNTSMNVRGEPVVETPTEAVEMLLCTHLDAMVLGATLVRRKSAAIEVTTRVKLAPKTLVRSTAERGTPTYEVCARARGNKTYPLDEATYSVLAHADGQATAAELLGRHVPATARDRVMQKIVALGKLGLALHLGDEEAALASADDLTDLFAEQQPTPVEQTVARVEAKRSVLGVTRVADLTDYDRVGIPVFSATRPLVHSAQITATQGKGMEPMQARASALMEAVERHAAALVRPHRLASVHELRGSGELVVGPEALGARFSESLPIEWVRTRNLRDGRSALIPVAEVAYPYEPPSPTPALVRPSTTGLASGNTRAEAVLQAICEVVERAAVSQYLTRRATVPLVDLAPLVGSPEGDLIARFESAGVGVAVFDLSRLAPLPTYYVSTASADNLGAPVVAAGQGTSTDARIALRRALLEAAQSRVVALQGSREDLVRHGAAWAVDIREACRLWEAERDRAARVGVVTPPPPSAPRTSTAEALRTAKARLAEAGYEDVYVTDLTQQGVGIPVVHVSIPRLWDLVVEPTRGANV